LGAGAGAWIGILRLLFRPITGQKSGLAIATEVRHRRGISELQSGALDRGAHVRSGNEPDTASRIGPDVEQRVSAAGEMDALGHVRPPTKKGGGRHSCICRLAARLRHLDRWTIGSVLSAR
jgi:hypothetical protein